MADAVLIVDDDADIRRFLGLTLRHDGFEVHEAVDADDALEQARAIDPDVILLDVMMPGVDGYEVCRRLRADPRTQETPVILLTAKGRAEDKIRGLDVGADDYVVKPFDPEELVARVNSVLRRSRALRDVSPLTGLPGNKRIDAELRRLVSEAGSGFAVLYADLDDFKVYNDHYGFMRGDEVLRYTAEVIRTALERHPSARNFLGHLGGDDFIAVTSPDLVEEVCREICQTFDRGIAEFYDAEDAERGYVEAVDRYGERRQVRPVSISVGVATTAHRDLQTQWEISAVATEMKHLAKGVEGSRYEIDRRRGFERGHDRDED
ncbi:MAG: response regulator [Actinobacteria bacterium]|nr:response regulator [Actinomycetota bacterium]